MLSEPTGPMTILLRHWRAATGIVRAELLASAWELLSVLLFSSAVVPRAFESPYPLLVFLAGLVLSGLMAPRLLGQLGWGADFAAALRIPFWLLGVMPLAPWRDERVLVATCGFGIMAFGFRRAVYNRVAIAREPSPSPSRMAASLGYELAENAAVVGIAGGHVMLLFSVAFLRTASEVVFRAWWQTVPVLAASGTVVFTFAVRALARPVLTALALGPAGERSVLVAGLERAHRVARDLGTLNLILWVVCIALGIASIHSRPGPGWADVVIPSAFGLLFAWGVSFYQRGWHEDTMRPAIVTLSTWTHAPGDSVRISLRRRMLSEFGKPVLFALTLSFFASVGMYRNLGIVPNPTEDFNAIAALSASFVVLVVAVGGLFVRAARELSDPLRRIALVANQVARGHLDEQLPMITGPTEVHSLGQSIEDMRCALAQTIVSLERERNGLEENVLRRTVELRGALDELKQAQAALVHGERMALLGQLVAGVAHEMHNPLNAVAGSISSIERLRGELSAMLDAYRAAESLLPEAQRLRLADLRTELDVAGALADLEGVAKVVASATSRCVAIVANLMGFARAATEPTPIDLHVGLQETRMLLGHRLRETSIALEFAFGELPPVTCVSGEINQVFMNLLGNAIDAIEGAGPRDATPPVRGRIVIRTEHRGDDVLVVVADDGPGVAPGLDERVFEPFFTTKSSGRGTGLGLSISREIVARHGGSLLLDRAGVGIGGACFVCRLPVVGGRAPARGRLRAESSTIPVKS